MSEFILFVLSCVQAEALRLTDPLFQGVLQKVYRIKKLKKETKIQQMGCRAMNSNNFILKTSC
jgi:hypothetical protein